MARARGITIRDVANRAGVSITAVSHALNDKGTISAATREKVKRVAEEMGYQADALARGLRRSRMGVIGLVLRPLDALGYYSPAGVDYFLRFSGAAAVSALDRGLSLMQVADLTRGPVTPLAFSLDGYIVTDPVVDDPVVALLERRAIPYVTLGRNLASDAFGGWAASDDNQGTLDALEHFAERGARDVLFLGGTDQNSWNLDCEASYRRWCATRGLTPRVLRLPEGRGEDGGREVAVRLLDEGLPDAVHSLTGRHAAGLQAELQARGVRVPEDVMVIAGSDCDQTRLASPAITSIDLNPELLARETVAMLDGLTRGATVTERRRVPTRLLVRGSTGGGGPVLLGPAGAVALQENRGHQGGGSVAALDPIEEESHRLPAEILRAQVDRGDRRGGGPALL